MTETYVITTFVTIGLALVGYFATYLNGLRSAQRKERLERVNKQLGEFYGPLYGLVDAVDAVWTAFRKEHRPSEYYFDPRNPATETDEQAWRLWMTTVFMPVNTRIYELVLSKTDLLIEAHMPRCLRDLCAHVAGYQPVLKMWENGNFSEHVSLIDYPTQELRDYASKSFNLLKAEQNRLLGRRQLMSH